MEQYLADYYTSQRIVERGQEDWQQISGSFAPSPAGRRADPPPEPPTRVDRRNLSGWRMPRGVVVVRSSRIPGRQQVPAAC